MIKKYIQRLPFIYLLWVTIFIIIPYMAVCQPHQLFVEIIGIKKNEGEVWVALYNNESTFLSDQLYKGERVEAKEGKVGVKFNNLEEGQYAISCFHDVDSNGKLDTKLFGIPSEPYGFSNNPKIIFSAPTFDDSKFVVSGSKTTIQIILR